MTNTVKTGRISALISQKSEIFASFPQGKPFAPHCGARRPQGRRIMNRVNSNLPFYLENYEEKDICPGFF
jgi:hypothetical protein